MVKTEKRGPPAGSSTAKPVRGAVRSGDASSTLKLTDAARPSVCPWTSGRLGASVTVYFVRPLERPAIERLVPYTSALMPGSFGDTDTICGSKTSGSIGLVITIDQEE